MYVTAHRVRARTGDEAVHAFLHQHGAVAWPDEVFDWPEINPGRLIGRRTVFEVGGNNVLSYLDLLAPDGTPASVIEGALEEFRQDLEERANPTVMVTGGITIRFGTNLGLEPQRATAFEELAHAATELHSSGG